MSTSPAPLRLPLSSGGGLRFLRWFARALTVAALWPMWYSFFGKGSFDWEAMMIGGPSFLVGFGLWWWSGYRVRHPTRYLEIDRKLGQARLQQRSVETSCSLDELRGWTYRSWRITSTSQGTRTTTTWYAARCEALGDHDLFYDTDRDACVAWTRSVDAAARPFDTQGWEISESTVEDVMRQHGLANRDQLLWTAAGHCQEESKGAGAKRRLDRATLEAAARDLSETTLAARLTERIDDLVPILAGVPATIVLTICMVAWAVQALPYLGLDDSSNLPMAVILGVLAGLIALGWRAVERPLIAAATALLSGAALMAKPFVAPITDTYMGEVNTMSLTSETHLYFLLPGLALAGLAVILVLSKKVKKAPVEGSVDAKVAKLDPPRPKPPDAGHI